MNFETFKVKRNEYVEWMTANGFNEGDCRKNGEFTAIEVFSPFFDFFIDIGANVGIFINQLNPKSSKFVLAFEPNPYLRKDLQEKISRGLLVERALSSKKGYAKFHIYNADDTTSSLLDRNDMMPHFTSKVESIDVELDILDGYMPIIEKESSKGIFIKIDAEGVEYPILQGACKVLCRPAPTFLMFEYSNAWKLGGHTLKDAFNLLDALGFKRLDRGLHLANLADGIFPSKVGTIGWPFRVESIEVSHEEVSPISLEILRARSQNSALSDLYLFWLALDGVTEGKLVTLSWISDTGREEQNLSPVVSILAVPDHFSAAVLKLVGGVKISAVASAASTWWTTLS